MRGRSASKPATNSSLHPLHMIEIVLQEQVVRGHAIEDAQRVGGALDEETRDIERIDRLQQQPDSLLGAQRRRVAQILDQRGLSNGGHDALGRAGKAVDHPAAELFSIAQCRPDTLPELPDSVRQGGNTTLTASPVARGQIEQHLR